MKDLSLRSRLILHILLIVMSMGILTGIMCWWQTSNVIDEVFDTQQILFAKRLATSDFSQLMSAKSTRLPGTRTLMPDGDKGNQEDDALGFAIFDTQGTNLLSDNDHGQYFPFISKTGFFDMPLEADDDDSWHILYIHAPDQPYIIAVGQEKDYRQEVVNNILLGKFAPWMLSVPLMLGMVAWIIGRDLRSLRNTARLLRHRSPEDSTPLDATDVPKEAKPLVLSLNDLFIRINKTLERERQFTADAAHELRSPLTALRIQSEVAMMKKDDDISRENALKNLVTGIDRTSRLVDQLLALSRLDSTLLNKAELSHIDWRELCVESLRDVSPLAEHKNIQMDLNIKSPPAVVEGSIVLLKMLLNNIVNNALRYTPEQGQVILTLTHSTLTVTDNGPGVMPGHISRLGERFFRPPGMLENGSGLGLSIVKRIARLHHFDVEWGNRTEGGFRVSLHFEKRESITP